MPGNDKTGPLGQGKMTGRGLGPCGQGFASRKRFRQGFGRCFGRRFEQFTPEFENAALTKEDQKKVLEAELKELESEKEEIKKSLKEL